MYRLGALGGGALLCDQIAFYFKLLLQKEQLLYHYKHFKMLEYVKNTRFNFVFFFPQNGEKGTSEVTENI